MEKILLIVILIAGCGQVQEVDLSQAEIVWQGDVSEDATLQKEYDLTMYCLEPMFSPLSTNKPFVIVVKGSLICYGLSTESGGCFSTTQNTIYLTYNMEYINFPHEVIHWATRLDNNYHDSIYFQQCEKTYKSI